MEEVRSPLQEDLSDSFQGELRTDAATCALYSTDASLYQIIPTAVAFPRDTRDVSVLAKYASENGISLVARGSGTGLAGGCLGAGIVIDFSRHMNQILKAGVDTIRVQPGATRDQINQTLKPLGRYLAPDPSNSSISSIGGMIGVDAAGSHAIRVGSIRDHVQSIQSVLIGGQILELGTEWVKPEDQSEVPVIASNDEASESFRRSSKQNDGHPAALTPATRKLDLIQQLSNLLSGSIALIKEHQPPLFRNCCGYHLRSVLRSVSGRGQINFPRLLTGSEGTLAITTEITLHTLPVPAAQGMLVVMFNSMAAAVNAMQELLVLEPAACDLLDRRLLSLGRDTDVVFHEMVDPVAEAGLFVEFVGGSQTEVAQRMTDAEALLKRQAADYRVTVTTSDANEVEKIWQLPSAVVPLLAGLKGASRPLPFVEDIAVPPPLIADFLKLAQRTFQKHEVTATVYAHAASGQLHLRPMLPLPSAPDADRLHEIASDLYQHVKAVNGSISGEHGDGLSRTSFVQGQYGPLYRIFKEVKQIFDPQNLLNPDKIISENPRLTVESLRPISVPEDPSNSLAAGLLPILNWEAASALDTALRCNGCGTCREVHSDSRMCPFFHTQSEESTSPRAKANLLRHLALASRPDDLLEDSVVRDVAESCFNCKQCETDCPSEVDIPHLMLELRAQKVAQDGLSRADRTVARFHTYAKMAARFPRLLNRLLRLRIFRKSIQRMTGIDARRRLPRFAKRPFLKSGTVTSEYNVPAPESTLPTVVYFVDYFANHHDTALAEAFVRILRHNGFHVHIPPQQRVSGLSLVNVGDVEHAKAIAHANLDVLGPLAFEGLPILCSEPSAALCLRREYPFVTEHEFASVVSSATRDAGEFLSQLHEVGKLKTDFNEVSMKLAYHVPCHVKKNAELPGLRRLLDLVPGLEVTDIEKGCSGMAGSFGLASEHFDQSVSIGRDLMDAMKGLDVIAGVSDCSGCRMQMEQESSRPTVHPIKLLAYAYGLMPSLEAAFRSIPKGTMMS
ncbi:MAG: FAD-linked oxidase C-terminal domain-containing protein [Fuerstiella sp.]